MNKKILLIDDDEDEHIIFKEVINEIDKTIKCTYAASVQEGINILKKFVPDIIFLDVNMPAINGLECLSLLKKNEHVRNIPVIIYSTSISENTQKESIAKGAAACIKKKNTIEELAETLKSFVSI